MTSRRRWPDQASRRRGQSPRQARSRQQRSLFQIDVQRIAAGPCGRTAHAIGNGPLLPGWDGQNGPPIAIGRKAWLFAGSDRGGERAAAMYSLIVTAKLNDIDPRAWLADVLARIADHPVKRLDELLPWNWRGAHLAQAAA